jgi:hypothetical protein
MREHSKNYVSENNSFVCPEGATAWVPAYAVTDGATTTVRSAASRASSAFVGLLLGACIVVLGK